jgi:hypothetical protein
MRRPRPHRLMKAAQVAIAFVGIALVAIALAGCSSSNGAPASSAAVSPPPSAAGSRPSSPAVIKVVQPASGSSVTGTTAHIVISLEGAQVVPATTTNVRPDQGHVHLYVDNALVSMNYGLEQDIAVHPGTYVVKAEFVAADHVPFSPRVWSSEVFFTVK